MILSAVPHWTPALCFATKEDSSADFLLCLSKIRGESLN